MANPEHLRRLKQGVAVWNEWRLQNPDAKIDLRWIDLIETKYPGVNLSDADLSDSNLAAGNYVGANFANATLQRTQLSLSNLTDASFVGAQLHHTNFFVATATRANFARADLSGAIFRFTKLNGADFTGAKVGMTVFVGYGFEGVKGLETIKHMAPSHVGIDTIVHSKQEIPRSFLRGTGLPEQLLDPLCALGRNAITFYSCFISYSTSDQAFADRLYADLQARGVRCWFAPHHAEGGKSCTSRLTRRFDCMTSYSSSCLLIA